MCGHVAASLAQTAAITCVQVVNSGASVAVRAGPSADANQVGAVSSGMTVAATAESASWLKITMADTGVASIEPQYFDPAGYILKSHPSAGPLLVPASGGQQGGHGFLEAAPEQQEATLPIRGELSWAQACAMVSC